MQCFSGCSGVRDDRYSKAPNPAIIQKLRAGADRGDPNYQEMLEEYERTHDVMMYQGRLGKPQGLHQDPEREPFEMCVNVRKSCTGKDSELVTIQTNLSQAVSRKSDAKIKLEKMLNELEEHEQKADEYTSLGDYDARNDTMMYQGKLGKPERSPDPDPLAMCMDVPNSCADDRKELRREPMSNRESGPAPALFGSRIRTPRSSRSGLLDA